MRALVSAAAVVSLLFAACGGETPPASTAPSSSGGSSEAPTTTAAAGGDFVMATVAEASSLDPALVTDNDSFRINNQMYETLVRLKPGSPNEIEPGLAESWTSNDSQTEWTFTLRSGVTFHDGTAFDAEAAKYNFDRWINLPPDLQGYAEMEAAVFGGFGAESNVTSVTAPDDRTLAVTLKQARPSFLLTLTPVVFGMASPTALEEFDANNPDPRESQYGTAHPTGTGPFKFKEWIKGDHLTVVRNDDYWGPRPPLDSVTFRPIADPSARLSAVQAGDVEAADLINPIDIPTVQSDPNLQLVLRGSCNSGLVGMQLNQAPFDKHEVRQAVAHAINKQALVDRFWKDAGQPASQFMPPSIFGYDESIEDYAYDPDLARQLLAAAGVPNPSVPFWYPTEVTRPWLPDSRGIFEAIKADLEAVGFTIEAQSATWTEFLPGARTGQYPLYILGWSCDWGSPDNFYVGLFAPVDGQPNPRFNYDNPELQEQLNAATYELDPTRGEALWNEVVRTVWEDIPGVPFVHGSSALAMKKTVRDYVPNPVFVESLAGVSLEQ